MDRYRLLRQRLLPGPDHPASSRDQTIQVVDTTPPDLTLPPDDTIECDEPQDPSNTGTATALDNCDGPVVPTWSDRTVPGRCPNEFTIVRTWTATDSCGNASSRDQTIQVVDTTPPDLTLPPDDTIECDEPQDPSNTGSATALDNCDGPVVPTWSDAILPGNCPGNYTILRTWSAVDSCGNLSSDTQTITVQDTTPPVVTESSEDLHCLWPPNHKHVSFGRADFNPAITDNCSEPIVWVFEGCASDQPDDGLGDGSTTDDCVVAPDGTGFLVRSERSGLAPAGRRYRTTIVATDACGNSAAPAGIGNIYVPHDQDPAEKACRRPAP